MGKALAATNVSIDDLLASIRQAIHDEVEPAESMSSEPSLTSDVNRLKAAMERHNGASARNGETHRLEPPSKPGQAPMMPRIHRPEGEKDVPERPAVAKTEAQAEAVVKAEPKTLVTGKREGFTGILGGDVRLEEALARLSRAGRAAIPSEPEPVPVITASATAEPEAVPLRSSMVDDDLDEADLEPPSAPIGELPFSSSPSIAERQLFEAAPLDDMPIFKPNGVHANGHAAPPPYVAPRLPELEWPAPQDEGRVLPKFQSSFAPAQPRLQPDLLSPSASSSTSLAFDRLAEALMTRTTGGDRSLEDVTRDLLRPLLKAWLDENLPGIVERMVREEIERVARRGGAR